MSEANKIAKEIQKTTNQLANLSFNTEQTEELIKELQQKGEIVQLEDLSTLIRQSGVLVYEHISKEIGRIAVTPEMLGINVKEMGEEAKNMFQQHLKQGYLSYLSTKDIQHLARLEGRVRVSRKRKSIGVNDHYMTLPEYRDFLAEYEGIREEFYRKVDEIVDLWDFNIDTFKKRLEIFLDEMNCPTKVQTYLEIIQSIPKKEDFAKKFNMQLEVRAFPTPQNLDIFPTDVREEIEQSEKKNTIETMYTIISSVLGKGFKTCTYLYETLSEKWSKGDRILVYKTFHPLEVTANSIIRNNVCKNDELEEFATQMLELFNSFKNSVAVYHGKKEFRYEEQHLEDLEDIIVGMYRYAKKLGVEDTLSYESSLHTKENLEILI